MKTTSNLTLRPDPVTAKVKQIGSLIRSRDLGKAEAAALELVQANPKRPDVRNILGIAYVEQKKRHLAIPHLEFAVKAEPRNPVYLNNLGRLYLELGAIELALPFLHNALTIDRNLASALLAIGEYYTSIGKADLALPYLERLHKILPDDNKVKWQIAESLDVLGRKEEANALWKQLRQTKSFAVTALYHLSRNNPVELNAPLRAEAERLLDGDELSDSQRSSLHTSLGFILEKEGEYRRAFEHFDKANRLTPVAFDIEEFRSWVDKVEEQLTADVLRARSHLGTESPLPVLVVGMPRSGTTLTEQVIASHGEAAGAGELTRIPLFAKRYNYIKDIGKFIATLDASRSQDIREAAENYVSLLRFHAPDALRIVDKLPHNFRLLGFVAMLWPNARIIHCSRNPVDTCLSCYQNPLSDMHPYSRNLSNLGLYYREYHRLMAHWRKVLPMQIYDLSYERLTAAFESEARKLIEFIGLSWDPACLKFNETESTVRTFSRQQVRNPIYSSSVERWRHYEAELQPLLAALGDLVVPSTDGPS
jgi:tetratricopeptide (TPR) repeat protein